MKTAAASPASPSAPASEAVPAVDPHALLRERFGLESFRPGQRAVIDSLLAGRSAVAVFPTGGGKSLCYQLPALTFSGVTIVISPLIALMKDQCDALAARGISAARLDSSLGPEEFREAMRGVRRGETKLLYVAPERFFNERFRAAVGDLHVSMFAVDEAHCISQWGHNFRPDYLKLAELAKDLQAERVLALTATATPQVLEDIRRAFAIDADDAVRTPFFRPNLQLRSSVLSDAQRDAELLARLKERPRGCTLVYVTLQKTAEQVAGQLAELGYPARAYHAGLEPAERAEIQQWFLDSNDGIVVATIAFGMGIDKSDIRYVYHYNPPKSLEAYAQEIGRAGRDGLDSTCETLLVPGDRIVLENFAYGDTPDASSVVRFIELIAGQAETFHISHYRLSSETDIRVLVARTLLTYLELDGYLRGTSPRYDTYQFRPLTSSQSILAHFSGERRQFIAGLLASAVKGRTWFSIPLPVAARRLGADRERLVKAIDYLAEQGWIDVRVSDLVHGYHKLKPITQPTALAEELHARLTDREQGEVQRLDEVFELIAANECQAATLSEHFGETMEQPCGRCTACTGDGPLRIPESHEGRIGRSAATAVRDLAGRHPEVLATPRQQARFLCGFTSPAMTRSKLSRDPHFGVCNGIPFGRVMQELS
ncbi:RecQ family ATP-dependent DNA helicase [Candidatus Laterigemmans baculatus]|uniref:RecQ family ATP-dependent DNA helicase n=1 Tax=Candidatus Laterigemmans baculatus TaxID=2770505 RepID=UPI0013DA8177|nr:ATP-dependent DNA helicase RecQ [Candidatus Laterigemmans baculatus]